MGLWAGVPACASSLGKDFLLQRCLGTGHRCFYSHGTPGLSTPHKSECEVKRGFYDPTQTGREENKKQPHKDCVSLLVDIGRFSFYGHDVSIPIGSPGENCADYKA